MTLKSPLAHLIALSAVVHTGVHPITVHPYSDSIDQCNAAIHSFTRPKVL